jgi:hypothetical protein
MSNEEIHYGIENESRYKLSGIDNAAIATDVRKNAAQFTGLDVRDFTGNGGRFYLDNETVEFCTAESNSPYDVIMSNGANRRLLHYALGKILLNKYSKYPAINQAVHYNRVIDIENNSWALHDNIGITEQQYDKIRDSFGNSKSAGRNFLVQVVGTRMMYTGAGLARADGWHFSQKRSVHHKAVLGREYNNFLFSIPSAARGTLPRIESRDNDNPWSDWSSMTRLITIGGAISLAASAFPLERLLKHGVDNRYLMPAADNPLNRFAVDDEGMLEVSPQVIKMTDFQLRILEALTSSGSKYGVTTAEDYPEDIEDAQVFLDLFKNVARKKLPVSELSTWVDWAAKADLARRRYARMDPKTRPNSQTVAQQTDIAFDMTTLSVTESRDAQNQARKADITLRPATGQRLRDAGKLGTYEGYLEDEVAAMTSPPPGSATKRVETIRKHRKGIKYVAWNHLGYEAVAADGVPYVQDIRF